MVGDSGTGTLVTAGGLVFCADSQGNFFALDATDGKPLWNIQLGNSVRANPITYAVDGRQYVRKRQRVTPYRFSACLRKFRFAHVDERTSSEAVSCGRA